MDVIEYKPARMPELDRYYSFFHDGKIRESRRYVVFITEIIPFSDINSEILELWEESVNEFNWLYARETDFFIKGNISASTLEEDYFVRTIDGGWFGIGFWAGRLDVDGTLLKSIQK